MGDQPDADVLLRARHQLLGHADGAAPTRLLCLFPSPPPSILPHSFGYEALKLILNLRARLTGKALYPSFTVSMVEKQAAHLVDVDPHMRRHPYRLPDGPCGLKGAYHGTAVELIEEGPAVAGALGFE